MRLTFTFILSLVTGALLAPPAAQAFTLENDPAKTIPKFDFDEQLRQFRNTPQLDTSTANKKGVETPFGTLQFGVQRNTSPFSSPYRRRLWGEQFRQRRPPPLRADVRAAAPAAPEYD